jgi:zinc D-Ala-D-Ala carboxypeptidase
MIRARYAAVVIAGLLAFTMCRPSGNGTQHAQEQVHVLPPLDATPFADVSPPALASAQPELLPPQSYGMARPNPEGSVACSIRKDAFFIAAEDQAAFYTQTSDLLAPVNRSVMGTLAPSDAPSDLVNLRTLEAANKDHCESHLCLRQEAAVALKALLADMQTRGMPGSVESAYRSYINQCLTFRHWAETGFCAATEQSALPGHSQHQLGTTVDLFSLKWKKDGGGQVFRPGFGCTDAGKYLREEAHRFGFVVPYPLHPDDERAGKPCEGRADKPQRINPLTGYKYEPWHLRYIGKEAALAFTEAKKDAPALSLEGFLRAKKHMRSDGDVPLPACDGCNCGACATRLAPGKGVCGSRAVHLTEQGLAIQSPNAQPPVILEASAKLTNHSSWMLHVRVRIPEDILTTTPVLARPERLARLTEALALDAFALGVSEGDAPAPLQWALGLSKDPHAQIYNGARVILPAPKGEIALDFEIEAGPAETPQTLRVGIARAGKYVGNEPVLILPTRP